jgi:hypothetical protein
MGKINWGIKFDSYLYYYAMCLLVVINDPGTCIRRKFSTYEFQKGEYKTLPYVPFKQNKKMWPNYFRF